MRKNLILNRKQKLLLMMLVQVNGLQRAVDRVSYHLLMNTLIVICQLGLFEQIHVSMVNNQLSMFALLMHVVAYVVGSPFPILT